MIMIELARDEIEDQPGILLNHKKLQRESMAYGLTIGIKATTPQKPVLRGGIYLFDHRLFAGATGYSPVGYLGTHFPLSNLGRLCTLIPRVFGLFPP